jgi:hypothetical protein
MESLSGSVSLMMEYETVTGRNSAVVLGNRDHARRYEARIVDRSRDLYRSELV